MMKYRFFCFAFFSPLLFAQETAPVGHTVAIEGVARSISPQQEERILQQKSPLFLADTIVVDPDAKVQIRFTDGGLLSLIASSEFRIDQYQYKKPKQKDRFLGSLLKGALRLLSGSIAKKNPDEYEIKTPSATIGLRGTIIEVSVSGTEVYVGVSDGAVFVSNLGGKTRIGTGAETQFAFVPSEGVKPQLIPQRPSELNLQFFALPMGGTSLDRPIQLPQQAPNSQSRSGPSTPETPAATEPVPARTNVGPKISETEEPTQSEYKQSPGSGASIQGGC